MKKETETVPELVRQTLKEMDYDTTQTTETFRTPGLPRDKKRTVIIARPKKKNKVWRWEDWTAKEYLEKSIAFMVYLLVACVLWMMDWFRPKYTCRRCGKKIYGNDECLRCIVSYRGPWE